MVRTGVDAASLNRPYGSTDTYARVSTSFQADSLALKPTTRWLMAAVTSSSIAVITFLALAAIPYETGNDPSRIQSVLATTAIGLAVGTIFGRLFGCSFRRTLTALLDGMVLGWIGEIAIAIVVANVLQSRFVSQNAYLAHPRLLRLVQDSPWPIATAVWWLGPFLSVAVLSRSLAGEPGPTRSDAQWIATVSLTILISPFLYTFGHVVSLYGRGRGLVTFGTAGLVAPWLGFRASDWLLRTALHWKGSPSEAAVRDLLALLRKMHSRADHIITSKGTFRESGLILFVGALIPPLGVLLSRVLFDVRIEEFCVYAGVVILGIGFVKLLLLLQIFTGRATLGQAVSIVCIGLAIPTIGFLLADSYDMRFSLYVGIVILVIGLFRLLLASIRFVARLFA